VKGSFNMADAKLDEASRRALMRLWRKQQIFTAFAIVVWVPVTLVMSFFPLHTQLRFWRWLREEAGKAEKKAHVRKKTSPPAKR
jgi:hypothetical protein